MREVAPNIVNITMRAKLRTDGSVAGVTFSEIPLIVATSCCGGNAGGLVTTDWAPGANVGGHTGASKTASTTTVLMTGVEITVQFRNSEACNSVASTSLRARLLAMALFCVELSAIIVMVSATLAPSATTATRETGTAANSATADATCTRADSSKSSISPAACVVMMV